MNLLNLFNSYRRKKIVGLDAQGLLEFLPGHVYVTDENEVLLACNKKQAEYLGLRIDDLIGKSFRDFYPWNTYKFIHENNMNIFKTGVEFEGEEINKLPNGYEERYISKKVLLKDKNNKPAAILGISFNLTQLLSSVSQTTALFDTILQAIPVNVFWCDKERIYQGCNDQQAKILGLKSRFEIIGKTVFDICEIIEPNNPNNKENALAIDKIDQEIMNTGIPQEIEEKYISKSGEVLYYFSQKLALKDEKGEIIGLVGVSMDVTDRKEKEQLQIERLTDKKMLDEREKFKVKAQQVAHDINSPLGGLMMLIARLDPKKPISENDRLSLQEALGDIRIVADELVNYDKIEADPGHHKSIFIIP